MPEIDGVYFYFFAQPFDESLLGAREALIGQHAIWRSTAKVEESQPGSRSRRPIERESWLAAPRPDLLILATSRDVLAAILERMDKPSESLALPLDLAEWSEIDWNAPVWALRRGRGGAPGVAVRYEVQQHILDLSLFTQDLPQRDRDIYEREFQTEKPRDGLWRLRSDLRERGDFPFHYAASYLGIGRY
jgi:hypothetical protein